MRRIETKHALCFLSVAASLLLSCGRPPGRPIQECGNGVIEGREDCDGTDLGDANCESLGAGVGTLACHDYCAYDTSGCVPVTCGDGVMQPGESCDGSDLGGVTCEDIGGIGGTLACGSLCALDASNCVIPGDCGNGIIEILEECDVGTLGGESCASLGLGEGDLACGNDCLFDTGGCSIPNAPPVADAGVDATALAGATVQLDGTASADPDGDPLTYLWTPVGTAPPLDDPTSATPSFSAPFCGHYTFILVVNDGHVDSAPDTVTISIDGLGPYVSVNDCVPLDECGSLYRPWCTITGGVEAAQTESLPAVYVKQGIYVQNTLGAVPDSMEFGHHADGDPEILGGFIDLANLTRAPEPSCDATTLGTGGTLLLTKTTTGVVFNIGSSHVIERFCLRSGGVTQPSDGVSRMSVNSAWITVRGNIFDGAEPGRLYTIGIDVDGTLSPLTAPPMVIEGNRDDPAAGIYFGGHGVQDSCGISVSGDTDSQIIGNSIHGGLGLVRSSGVFIFSSRRLYLEGNDIDGGEGQLESSGVTFDLGSGETTLLGNTISGGSSPGRAVAVHARTRGRSYFSNNLIVGRPDAVGREAIGLLAPVGDVLIDDAVHSNVIRGGRCTERCTGVQFGWANTMMEVMEILGSNEIRGGIPEPGSAAQLRGISVHSLGLFRLAGGNVVSGADVDPQTNRLARGGAYAVGIEALYSHEIEITDNLAILGGAPNATDYQGVGIYVDWIDDVRIEQNDLIQGCLPVCGPGVRTGGGVLNDAAGVGVSFNEDHWSGYQRRVQNNLLIRGGPVQRLTPGEGSRSVGVEMIRTTFETFSGTRIIAGNGLIVGSDATELDGVDVRPEQVFGVRYVGPEMVIGAGGDRLELTGEVAQLQTIAGGVARDGAAVGVDVSGVRELLVSHNRIWGGVVTGGDVQRGAVVANVDGLCVLEANLIEACGVVGAGSVVHDPACEVLNEPSVGLEVSDDVGAACHVFNNRVFGGFSAMGSTGMRVVDHGSVGRTGQVVVYNNYVNAQGPWGAACTSPPWAGSQAVELVVGAGVTGTTGEGLAFHNNIFDGGGRACRRYGVFEAGSTPAEHFDLAVFTHNAWVQVLAGRDNGAAGAAAWAYREADGTVWCEAGVEVVEPGQCLDGAQSPGAAAGFAGNREGDPVFAGSDTDISERPGALSLADFHATAAVLQSNGTQSLPVPVAADYEGDPRTTAGPTCDIGHDETP